MKILHLLYESKGDYFGIGGVGIRAYEIYRHLKDRHDITLLCKKYPGAKDGDIEGLRHIFVGTESKNLTKTLLFYAYQASRFVKKFGNRYDVIIEDFSPAIPTFLHTLTEKLVVLQVQGYTGWLYLRKYNPAYATTLYVLERLRPMFYDNFIFISAETVKRFSLKGRRYIEVIPNGVSSELLTVTPEDGDYILYLGRIDIYGKGLDILLSAYSEFFKSFPDIRLAIAGDGRDRKRFEAMLMNLSVDIRKNIELIGWVNGERKREVISKALFCVFPSRHEAQGISVLEAMACGKAVIVSDIPEFRYVLNSGSGLSFVNGDSSSLAQLMREMVTSNRRMDMGEKGRNSVLNLTWDKVAGRFEGFLFGLLKRSATLIRNCR